MNQKLLTVLLPTIFFLGILYFYNSYGTPDTAITGNHTFAAHFIATNLFPLSCSFQSSPIAPCKSSSSSCPNVPTLENANCSSHPRF